MDISEAVATNVNSMRGAVCLCCSAEGATEEWALVSPFLAERSFQEKPSKTKIFRCMGCGFCWSERGLSYPQAQKLYDRYRDSVYLNQRHRHEPWYTASKNHSLGSGSTIENRMRGMVEVLDRAKAIRGQRAEGVAVDFGGDKGQMLKDLPDSKKWVYDFSEVEPDPWAHRLSDLASLTNKCDIVLCCQVLEHVDNPQQTLCDLVLLAKKDGWIYLEVPKEPWRQSMAGASWRAGWLDFVIRHYQLQRTLDFISTASRISMGWIPPFGFWSMREHLNFFTTRSLIAMAEKAGLDVVVVDTIAAGYALVGIKK